MALILWFIIVFVKNGSSGDSNIALTATMAELVGLG
jgi:hypothetical protein